MKYGGRRAADKKGKNMLTVQWYDDKEWIARIFEKNGSESIADLNYCDTPEEVDHKLRIFGLRRRETWQKREWGLEAELRKL